LKINTCRSQGSAFAFDIESAAALIARTQYKNGEIPWSDGQKTDPWDHVEAAMGLCVGGYLNEARRAYQWLARMQLPDGSWFAAYQKSIPLDRTKDVNFCTYIAVGLFHYYLITCDRDFVAHIWPTIVSAIDFCVSMQAPGGEIYWAQSPDGKTDRVALLTGCCAIFMSLKCALALAALLQEDFPEWRRALNKLEIAIRFKPHLFDPAKARFSMDWFYPVLSGALTKFRAQQRIDQLWEKFIVWGYGVKCVSDKPWITIAETSELAIALAAMGNLQKAETVFKWILDKKYEDGSYWCGYTCPDLTIWPEDKITWTNAAVLLAADAIHHLTPAGCLFYHRFWEQPDFHSATGRKIFWHSR
jgi:hypothetical protein